MFSELRRAWRYRRKVRRAGLRILRKERWPLTSIRYPTPNTWAEEWYAGTLYSAFASPHYASLVGVTPSPYTYWHQSLRGIDHPRPDWWITTMEQRLHALSDSIATGYRCQCVADRIAVFPDGALWDGGHRLACLAYHGHLTVPVLVVARRTSCGRK